MFITPLGDDPNTGLYGSRSSTPREGGVSDFVWDASEQYGFYKYYGQYSSGRDLSRVTGRSSLPFGGWNAGMGRSDWSGSTGSDSYRSEVAAAYANGGYEYGGNAYTKNGGLITTVNGHSGVWIDYYTNGDKNRYIDSEFRVFANNSLITSILGENDIFGILNYQDKADHPGRLNIGDNKNSNSDIALHLIKALRWSYVNNKDLDLNSVFSCLNTMCLFESRGTTGTQHYSGKGKLKFGDQTVSVYFEIPMTNGRTAIFSPGDYEPNPYTNPYVLRFERGHGLFGINLSVDHKSKYLIRKYIGID